MYYSRSAFIGVLLFILAGLRLLSDVDFVVTRVKEPGWILDTLNFLVYPPGWFTYALIFCGLSFSFYAFWISRNQIKPENNSERNMEATQPAPTSTQDEKPDVSPKVKTDFKLSIERYALCDYIEESEGKRFDCLDIWAWVTVRNLGEPSIAESWVMDITLSGKPLVGARKVQLSTPIMLGSHEVKPEDFIGKITTQPIGTGCASSGYVLYDVLNKRITDFDFSDTEFTVSCKDITGRKYQATAKYDFKQKGGRPQYNPFLD